MLQRAIRSWSAAYRRTVSSWTMVDIPGRFDNGATGSTTLYLREQFTSPPGATKDTTGRRLWPTALPLLQWIRQHEKTIAKPIKKPTVLELGAGCGLVGMGLASSGDYGRVILTDASIEWLQQNVDKNRSQFSCPVDVLALQWGARKDHDALRSYFALPEQSSNCYPTVNQSLSHVDKNGIVLLDYIVGSDLLYNPCSQRDLVATLGELASPSTRVLLAVPQRSDNESSFRVIAEDHGFVVEVSALPIPSQHDNFQQHVLMTLVKG